MQRNRHTGGRKVCPCRQRQPTQRHRLMPTRSVHAGPVRAGLCRRSATMISKTAHLRPLRRPAMFARRAAYSGR